MARLFKSNLRDRAEKSLVKELTDYGEMIIKEAYNTKTFEDQTFNLHDSYGSAVYKDGNYINGTMRTLEPQATQTKKVDGYHVKGKNVVSRYLKDYRPRQKGLTLVVVAAMPYGDILEAGKEPLTHKYRVISGARWMMRSLAYSLSSKFGIKKHGMSINSIDL